MLVVRNFYDMWKGAAEDAEAQGSTMVPSVKGDLLLALSFPPIPTYVFICSRRGSAGMRPLPRLFPDPLHRTEGAGRDSSPHPKARESQIVTFGPRSDLPLETSAHVHKGTSTQRKEVLLAFHLDLHPPPRLGCVSPQASTSWPGSSLNSFTLLLPGSFLFPG